MIRRRTVSDERELLALADDWWSLLARSASDEPMLSPLWLGTWWRVFGARSTRALRCLLVTDGATPIGLAPLLRRVCWHLPFIPLRRIEPLGSGEAEHEEICSEYIGIVAAAGAEELVARAIVDALLAGELGGWDELVLPAMDAGAPAALALQRALERAGVSLQARLSTGAPYIALPTSWEAYTRLLPARSRYLLRRTERDLRAWAGGDLAVQVATTAADLARGSELLRALHRRRWNGAGAFAATRFDRFHAEVMPALLARGALDLSWLTARGEPIAALYNLVWNDKVYYYQSGRRTDLVPGVRPGIALHAAAIRRAIAAGHREYDFLAGTQRFKRQLALAERPILELRAVRGGTRERAIALTRRAARAVRARAGRSARP